jgi:flagellar hook-associated protein 3 FlgL
MRINPNPTPDVLAALQQAQGAQQAANEQLATGKRVNRASDDPVAAALLTVNQAQAAATDQYLQNLTTLQSQMQTADSTLNSVETALNRAITLGVEGATGTMSDANRTSLANEVAGIQAQMMGLANVSFQGRFVFAGTATATQPFVSDDSAFSGVAYQGNNGANLVDIGNGVKVQVNLPGAQIFMGPGGNVFQALHDLQNALGSGTAVDAAVSEVRAAYDHVSAQRVFYGNALSVMDGQQSYLQSEKVELASRQASLGDADLAVVATQFNQATLARNTTLAAAARILQSSLFDYLK